MTSAELKIRLNEKVEDLCQILLPGGRRIGQEWHCGSIVGDKGDSLRVQLTGDRAGLWIDFADKEHSGDMFDLWCKCKGVDFVTAIKQLKQFLGIEDVSDSKNTFYGPRKNYVRPSVDVIEPMQSGGPVYDYLTKERGIYPEVLEKYKVGQFNSSTSGATIVFPCYDTDGKFVDLIKFLAVNRINGKKNIWASQNAKPRLFGWQSIKPNDRNVVITEGEIDALTVSGFGFPALSVPQGAANLEWIEQDFDALQRFEKIYVLTDMDDPGEKAAAEICERLGRERCYRVNLEGYKDINEALCSKKYEGPDFEETIAQARTLDPVALRNLGGFSESAWEKIHPTSQKTSGTEPPFNLPWRCRFGELTIWSGFSGHGKSLMLNQFLINDAAQGERVCICSLEIPPGATTAILAKMALGYTPTIDRKDKFTHAVSWLADRFWIINHVGMMHWTKILPIMEYAARRYGCTRFAIDSLLLCGIPEDDYNGQKEFVSNLTAFAGMFGHVHLICHSRKKEDESKAPGKLDIRGSGSLTDICHNGFTVWRNKEKERELEEFLMSPDAMNDKARLAIDCKRDACLVMWKNRETGDEPFRSLWLNRNSGQFVEQPGKHPKQYVS